MRPAVLAAGHLTLDPASHRATLAGAELALTPREFALLQFLLRRKGEAVSKRDILDSVWDIHYEGDPNIVEVYVGYLRKKLEIPGVPPPIETVRGVGYRLVSSG